MQSKVEGCLGLRCQLLLKPKHILTLGIDVLRYLDTLTGWLNAILFQSEICQLATFEDDTVRQDWRPADATAPDP